MAFAKAPSREFKHFRTRTASSRTRVSMPVVQDHELVNFLMLATQFVLQAYDFLEPAYRRLPWTPRVHV